MFYGSFLRGLRIKHCVSIVHQQAEDADPVGVFVGGVAPCVVYPRLAIVVVVTRCRQEKIGIALVDRHVRIMLWQPWLPLRLCPLLWLLIKERRRLNGLGLRLRMLLKPLTTIVNLQLKNLLHRLLVQRQNLNTGGRTSGNSPRRSSIEPPLRGREGSRRGEDHARRRSRVRRLGAFHGLCHRHGCSRDHQRTRGCTQVQIGHRGRGGQRAYRQATALQHCFGHGPSGCRPRPSARSRSGGCHSGLSG